MNGNKDGDKSIIGSINVSGGTVNVVGKGTINQYSIGTSSRDDFVKMIKQIEDIVRSANLDTDTKRVVENDLKSVVEQAQKQNPQSGLILNRLKGTLDLITSLGSAVAAGQTIYPLLQQAYDIAKNLFLK